MLSRPQKIWLLIEVLICFGPMAIFLMLGITLVPIQFDALHRQPLLWEGPASVIGSVFCGMVGLVTLIYFLGLLFTSGSRPSRPTLVCLGVALGLLPVITFTISSDMIGLRILSLLPIAASLHILYLSRHRLFSSRRQMIRSIAFGAAIAAVLPILFTFDWYGVSQEDLELYETSWSKLEPQAYEYSIQVSRWVSADNLRMKRVVIKNGEIISAINLLNVGDKKARDPAPTGSAWSIGEVFAELLAAKRDGMQVRLIVDDQWGFVQRAFVEPETQGSVWEVEVRDFRALSNDSKTSE